MNTAQSFCCKIVVNIKIDMVASFTRTSNSCFEVKLNLKCVTKAEQKRAT